MYPEDSKAPSLQHLYAFTLGREWKLSLAELFAVWWADSYREHSETVAIFQIVGYSDDQIAKKFLTIGGSIRVMKIVGETDPKRFPTDVIRLLEDATHRITERNATIQSLNDSKIPILQSTKITFALGAYGLDYPLSNIGLRIKKTLSERGYSVRLVNTENENIVSAVFKREKLGRTGTELNLVAIDPLSNGEWKQENSYLIPHISYLAITLACQDIDSYARRDMGKSRDMVVGMMPPKLVQMMINIALSTHQPTNQPTIYDPFCGLGTTLIEAANMGMTRIYGSDLSPEMVRASEWSLSSFIKEEIVWQDRIRAAWGTPSKDFSDFVSDVFSLDARKVKTGLEKIMDYSKTPTLQHSNISIVSEGYLGEMMGPRDITLEKVQSERKKLASLYTDFFRGIWGFLDSISNTPKLKDSKTPDLTIVMSFPFWNMHGTYSYFTEIYDVIEKCGFQVIDLLPGEMKLNTRHGSLLYRRENQTVGREIVKIIKR